MTPWSRQSQRPHQGSPSILVFELVLCITLPGLALARSTTAGPFHGEIPGVNPQGLSSPDTAPGSWILRPWDRHCCVDPGRAGLQARFACKEQALILTSLQLGHLVVIGNLVAHQPPAQGTAPPPVSLDKLLRTAAEQNDAAEAAYNGAMIQWEQVNLRHSVHADGLLSLPKTSVVYLELYRSGPGDLNAWQIGSLGNL